MGYTTDFFGEFELDRPLAEEHFAYLLKFNETRRMKRYEEIAAKMPDPVREAAGLPIGTDGAYFVGGSGWAGQASDSSIVNYNQPPSGQPGLWCQWMPGEDGACIQWDEGEKFYDYVNWLEYLIEHFLRPWGYVLNGEVEWRGEDSDDVGTIVVKDNRVGTRSASTLMSSVTWLDATDEQPAKLSIEEHINKLHDKLQLAKSNTKSIDDAMRVEGATHVARMAWECATRYIDEALDALADLRTAYNDTIPADPWGEDHHHSRADWQYEVANGDTTLGYWEWVANMKEQDEE